MALHIVLRGPQLMSTQRECFTRTRTSCQTFYIKLASDKATGSEYTGRHKRSAVCSCTHLSSCRPAQFESVSSCTYLSSPRNAGQR